jgi:hypothetical protein
VKSINEIYQDTVDIIIVDSCSRDKTYFELSQNFPNVFIEDIRNKNYEYGAILHGFKKYNNYEKYVFLQDSMRINSPITELDSIKNDEVYVFGDRNKYTGWLSGKFHKKHFYDSHKNFPDIGDAFLMTEWNCFCVNKPTFQKIINSDIFLSAAPAHDKITSCVWERVWTIVFLKNNINMKTLNEESYSKVFGKRK